MMSLDLFEISLSFLNNLLIYLLFYREIKLGKVESNSKRKLSNFPIFFMCNISSNSKQAYYFIKCSKIILI